MIDYVPVSSLDFIVPQCFLMCFSLCSMSMPSTPALPRLDFTFRHAVNMFSRSSIELIDTRSVVFSLCFILYLYGCAELLKRLALAYRIHCGKSARAPLWVSASGSIQAEWLLHYLGSSALRSFSLSRDIFTTMASADFSAPLRAETSPGKVYELSTRADSLYLIRLSVTFGFRAS